MLAFKSGHCTALKYGLQWFLLHIFVKPLHTLESWMTAVSPWHHMRVLTRNSSFLHIVASWRCCLALSSGHSFRPGSLHSLDSAGHRAAASLCCCPSWSAASKEEMFNSRKRSPILACWLNSRTSGWCFYLKLIYSLTWTKRVSTVLSYRISTTCHQAVIGTKVVFWKEWEMFRPLNMWIVYFV